MKLNQILSMHLHQVPSNSRKMQSRLWFWPWTSLLISVVWFFSAKITLGGTFTSQNKVTVYSLHQIAADTLLPIPDAYKDGWSNDQTYNGNSFWSKSRFLDVQASIISAREANLRKWRKRTWIASWHHGACINEKDSKSAKNWKVPDRTTHSCFLQRYS